MFVVITIPVVLMAKLGARADPEVLGGWTSKQCRGEVELRTVERERWGIFSRCAIDDRPQVHRRGPRIGCARPSGHPQILSTVCSRPIGGQEHFQAVPPDVRAKISEGAAEFHD
jgi:hypothetical protein